MKSSAVVCAIAAASLSLGSLSAFAQGHDPYDRNASNNPEIYRQTHPGPEGDLGARNLRNGVHEVSPNQWGRNDGQNRRNDRRWSDNRRNHDGRYDNGNAYNDRAPGPFYYGARGPEFRRGAHIPDEYRNHQYYVNDWRAHRLSPPPRGYQWVEVGGDYVLIALATGLIANLILNH